MEIGLDDGGRQFTRQLDLSGISKGFGQGFPGQSGAWVFAGKLTTVLDEVTAEGAAARRVPQRGPNRGDQRDIDWPFRAGLVHRFCQCAGRELRIEFEREGERMVALVTPGKVKITTRTSAESGSRPRVDRTGTEGMQITVRANPVAALYQASVKVWDMSIFSLKMMWRMITGHVSWKNLSGPVTIADYAGQTAQMGWIPLCELSGPDQHQSGSPQSLPIPVLDGVS